MAHGTHARLAGGLVAAGVSFDGYGGGESAIRIPKFVAVFDGRVGSVQTVPLTPPMSTEGWVTGVLSIRLHQLTYGSATCKATVVVQNAIQTPDDPSIIYAADLLRVDIVNGDVAPKLYTSALSTPIGPMLRIVLEFTQGATATAASTISISVDLVGRTS